MRSHDATAVRLRMDEGGVLMPRAGDKGDVRAVERSVDRLNLPY